jgi:acyl-CoA dehydrogenase
MDKETLTGLQTAVRRFTRERLVPMELAVEQTGRVPEEILREMRELGLFGLTVPVEYGGLGLTSSEEVALIQEISWASAAFRSIIGVNLGVGSQGLVHEGTEEQKRRWLPGIASGEIITSFALTEPNFGSDAASLTTSAVRSGDSYVLNGVKRYISNAPIADLITVMARTGKEKLPGNAHVSAFLVPADTPGVSVGASEHKMGQSGSQLSDLIFDNVRIPASNLLGGVEGRGFSTAMKVLDRGRVNVASVCVGQGRRILFEASRYAVERQQFGQRLADFQLIQAMLADSYADLYAAECMLLETARRLSAGERVSIEAAATKMFASEMVGRIADRAVQIHGGAGYMRGCAVERLYRDVRVYRILEGTTQIQQIIIGKELARRIDQGSFEQ